MPTTFLEYAVDGDGNGKVDLWNSTDDALTSAANFLMHLGWQRNERWGREVMLPKHYDFAHLGRSHKQPLSVWRELGFKQANGALVPALEMQAALYVPAGHTGPAFLGYSNFEVIQRWNRSEFYALAVGHLADRIMGASPLNVPAPIQPRRTRDGIKTMQTKLIDLGYDIGTADGVIGGKTRTAIRDFQSKNQLVPDGFADDATLRALGIDVALISSK